MQHAIFVGYTVLVFVIGVGTGAICERIARRTTMMSEWEKNNDAHSL